MTENYGENIVGISYLEIFSNVKLSMHKWCHVIAVYDFAQYTFEAKHDVIKVSRMTKSHFYGLYNIQFSPQLF